jgi:cyanophycin synthetase
MQTLPGRFNLLEIKGATVIMDYGHNVPSLVAMIEAIQQLPQRRRTVVYTAAGDRRNCDMIRQGELLAGAFDKVILYEDQYVRGRNQGEIMALLRQGISASGRAVEVDEIKGAFPAIELVLDNAAEGDLILLQCDTVDETVDFVKQYMDRHRVGREIDLDEVLCDNEMELVHSTALAGDHRLHASGSISTGAATAAAAVAVGVAELATMPVD